MPKHQHPHRDERDRHDRDDDDKEPGYRKHRNNGERQLFEEMVQRRLGGGATPTSEAYANAMKQWQALPGAVQFVAVPSFPESDSPDNATPEEPAV